MTTTTLSPESQIYVQYTSIPHLMALADGTIMLDLQPVTKDYRVGDQIIYKAFGDRYDEKLIKLEIDGIQKGWQFGCVTYQLLILDYPKGDQIINSDWKKVFMGVCIGVFLYVFVQMIGYLIFN